MSNNPKPKPTETNGGIRSIIDRRQFSYTAFIPERRSGKDRRANINFQKSKAVEPRKKAYD
jgi:hypothetical protein